MVRRSLVLLIAVCLLGGVPAAMAQDQPTDLFSRESLTGAWFGAGYELRKSGIAINATEISEVMGVVTGGVGRGTIYEGRLELDLDLDLDRLIGVPNTIIHANAYQIHGRGLTGNYLGGNIETVSNIEATRTTRLSDLWLEHQFLDGALSIRAGQIAADDEFITSQNTAGFMNSTFGWPAIMAEALPSGGPVYPLATPGVRIKYAVSNAVVVQAAIFNGDPAGGDPGTSNGPVDPQASNPDGLRFPVDHGPFVIAELSYSPRAESETAPTTVYKVGMWRQGGRYDDLAIDGAGISLAAPGSGRPQAHDGDFGGYFIADRQLYRPSQDQDRALSAFLRLAAAPAARSPVSFYVDSGLAFKGPFADRPDDLASFGVAFAQISGAAADLIHAQQRFDGARTAAPDFQAVIELNYQFAIAQWWSVQPDLQYIFHPTTVGVRPNPEAAVPHINNALVAGFRTSIRF
jgi:porin